MVKKYLNGSDVRMKLQRSVVMYKKLPYYAECFDDNGDKWMKLQLTPLYKDKDTKPIEVLHFDDDLDTSSPELGYMNYTNTAHYLMRVPARVQNQGVRSENIWTMARGLSGRYISSPEFADMLMNKYPSLTEAEAMLNSLTWDRVAISKHFAIGFKPDLNFGLFYKDKLIGKKDPTTGQYSVDRTKNSSFIVRLLDKTGVING